ncbi:MAG: hypothetical protein NZ740_03310 [Kiritimatiellae bacterium]|nr:hypothetical protein [Kiritimatiellia bacterium]MDW8458120.1 hypothetical protein [Verrucomicrobiota bacterium]
MRKVSRAAIAGLVVLIICVAVPPGLAQEFRLTPPRDIVANPQRYWARGVVFRDTLLAIPSSDEVEFAGRTLYKFTTRIIGDCYADRSIAPVLRNFQPGNEYIFTATVLSENRGLIRKRTEYRVVVEGVAAPMQEATSLTPIAQALERALQGDNPFAARLQELRNLIIRLQEAVTALAASEQAPREDYFNPKSPRFEKLMAAARRMVAELGVEAKTPPQEMYAELLVAMTAIVENHVPLEPSPPATQPDPQPQQPPSAATSVSPPPAEAQDDTPKTGTSPPAQEMPSVPEPAAELTVVPIPEQPASPEREPETKPESVVQPAPEKDGSRSEKPARRSVRSKWQIPIPREVPTEPATRPNTD